MVYTGMYQTSQKTDFEIGGVNALATKNYLKFYLSYKFIRIC